MNREKTYTVDTVFIIVLFFVFTSSVLIVLMLGTRIYNSMSDSSEIAYSERTCMSYIAEKLRHGDREGSTYVGEFDGLNALYIETDYDGITYNNILYFNDGWLYELFCDKGAEFVRTDGTKIIEAESVSFAEAHSGLFCIEAIDLDGNKSRLNISLRSGG